MLSYPDDEETDGRQEEITGGRGLFERVKTFITMEIPPPPTVGGALGLKQGKLVRTELDKNKSAFYKQYPENQTFTLYFPANDAGKLQSWTTFSSSADQGDRVNIVVKNPYDQTPSAKMEIVQVGGADRDNIFTFEFRIKRGDLVETQGKRQLRKPVYKVRDSVEPPRSNILQTTATTPPDTKSMTESKLNAYDIYNPRTLKKRRQLNNPVSDYSDLETPTFANPIHVKTFANPMNANGTQKTKTRPLRSRNQEPNMAPSALSALDTYNPRNPYSAPVGTVQPPRSGILSAASATPAGQPMAPSPSKTAMSTYDTYKRKVGKGRLITRKNGTPSTPRNKRKAL
jgi:hypothetical protein